MFFCHFKISKIKGGGSVENYPDVNIAFFARRRRSFVFKLPLDVSFDYWSRVR